MGFTESVLVLLSIVSLITLLGLIGCVRALLILKRDLEEKTVSPQRIQIGDRIRPPRALHSNGRLGSTQVYLFLSPDCGACDNAALLLSRHSDSPNMREAGFFELWRLGRDPRSPAPSLRVKVVEHAADVFEMFHVRVTPFFTVVADGIVTAKGTLGSARDLANLSAYLDADQSTKSDPIERRAAAWSKNR